MADETLTINNADGSSKTYTINRDKFAGVRSMQVNGQTVTVDRTAVPKEQDRETTFGGTQSITVKRDIDPLLNKVVGGAAAAYSLRDLNDKQGNNKVVRVRRSSDNAEKDFLGKDVDGIADWVNGKQDTTLPCDVASAAAAYSLRPVNSNYTGNIVRVRRSSDNAEQDFSDVSLIADWVGSGNDGYVTSWYDQSGNGNNATQSTASSQPKIVDGGVLVSDGIEFDGVDDKLVKSSFEQGALSQPNYIFSVSSIVSDLGYVYDGSNSTSRNLLFKGSNLFQMFAGNSQAIKTSDTNVHLFSSLFNQNNSHAYIDGVLEGSNLSVGSQSMGGITIGARHVTSFTQGTISEIIIYDSDQSANRFKIESNINNHYGLYTNANDGFVTTWYDQSGNSNDATQSTAASQPKIVDAGVLVSDGIDFDGSSDFLGALSLAGATAIDQTPTIPFVWDAKDNGETFQRILNYGNWPSSGYAITIVNSTKSIEFDFRKVGGKYSVYNTASNVFNYGEILEIIAILNKDGPTLYINGSTITLTETTAPNGTYVEGSTHLYIGNSQSPSSNRYTKGGIPEIIIYNSDQSANRAAIETNINNYYDIY